MSISKNLLQPWVYSKESWKRPVKQIDPQTGEVIRVWNSIQDAARELKIQAATITAVCRKRRTQRAVGGYSWVYADGSSAQYQWPGVKPKKEVSGKSVLQFTKSGRFLKEWISISAASRSLGICGGSIGSCARGQYQSAGGYLWTFCQKKGESTSQITIDQYTPRAKPVLQFSKEGQLIRQWADAKMAAEELKISVAIIRRCAQGAPHCKSAAGYQWRYLDETIAQCNDIATVNSISGSKSVLQINKITGAVLKKWNSVNSAAKQLKISGTCIRKCANGQRSQASGYIWKYK